MQIRALALANVLFYWRERCEENMKKKSCLKVQGLFLSLLVLTLLFFPGSKLFAQDFTEENVKGTGLAQEDQGLKPSYYYGKYLGDLYFMVESLSADGKMVIEPIIVPLYQGETLADIVNYQIYANMDDHEVFRKEKGFGGTYAPRYYKLTKDQGDEEYGRKPEDIKSNFTVNGLLVGPRSIQNSKEIDSKFNIPSPVLTYVEGKSMQLDNSYRIESDGVYKNKYLKNGVGSSKSLWEAYLNGEKLDKPLNKYKLGKEVQEGAVFSLSFSILGEDRGYQTPMEEKIDLIKALARINSSGNKFLYLENQATKQAYDQGVDLLKSFQYNKEKAEKVINILNQATINEHVDKPCGPFAWYMSHDLKKGYFNDFLLSNLCYTLKKGEEMELFCLDVPRATDFQQNFQREDLKFDPVLGEDKVEICKEGGDFSTIYGPNTQDGATYLLRGLKTGLVKLKVTHPSYNGRPSYIYVYITDRETDQKDKRLTMTSNLDRFNKYDVLYYTKEQPNYHLSLETEKGARPTVYANGQKVDLKKSGTIAREGKDLDAYTGDFPLQNFWTTVTYTVEKNGVKSSRLYNFRSACLEGTLTSTTGKTDLQAGDQAEFKIKGMLAPKPKIQTFYNPFFGQQEQFFTNMPGYGYIQGYDSFKLTLTKGGDLRFFNGVVVSSGYGDAGFSEVPKNQMPENTKIRQTVLSKMADGLNRPQFLQEHDLIPDFTFHVKENPSYKPSQKGLIQASPEKSSYRPGERVKVKVHFSDQQIQDLNNLYDKYVVPENKGQNQHDGNTTAINFGYLLYTSNMPGLERLETKPYVNNMTTNPVEKIRRLEKLRDLEFTLPEDIKPGDYFFNGGYLQVFKGPVYGLTNIKHYMGELGGFTIHVEGNPIHDETPKLDRFEMLRPEFVVPGKGELQVNGQNLEATVRSYGQEFVLTTKDTVDFIQMESISPRSQFPIQNLESKDYKTFKSSHVPISKGKNILAFTLTKEGKSSVYLLNLTNLYGEKIEGKDIQEIKDLKALLDKAEQAKEKDYNPSDWVKLNQAKRKYQTMLDYSSPTSNQLTAAIQDLKTLLANTKIPKENPSGPTETIEVPGGQKILGLHSVEVKQGTSVRQALDRLPKTIYLVSDQGQEEEISINWRLNNFRSDLPGTYTALGNYLDPLEKKEKVLETQVKVLANREGPSPNTADKPSQTIYKTIQVGDAFSLPSRVDLKEVDGQVTNREVYWTNTDYDLKKPGTYNILGYLSNTGERILLKLTVIKGGQENSQGLSRGQEGKKEVISIPANSARKNERYGQGLVDIQGHWAQEVIEKCLQEGLFVGVDDQHFAPNRPISQGEFLTLLGRMAGIQDQEGNSAPYYAPFRDWAIQTGIVDLKSFKADKILNREEMADLTYKALKVMGKDLSPKKAFDLKDKKKISKAYQDSVVRLVQSGYLQGTEKKTFDPKAQLTRAQVAQILWTLYKK